MGSCLHGVSYEADFSGDPGVATSITRNGLTEYDQMFSHTTIEAIKSYVYALADGNEIFYIGKGQGNRVFDHVEEVRKILEANPTALLTDEEESDSLGIMSPKRLRIARILQREKGSPPAMYIIREGLTPEQALLVEATLISVLDWQLDGKLTNRVSGHGEANFGLRTVEEIEAIRGEPFQLSALPDLKAGECVIAININRSWQEVEAGKKTLLEVSRGWWKVDRSRADQCRFAIIHSNRIVRGVFEIKGWETEPKGKRSAFLPKYEEPLDSPQLRNKNVAPLFGPNGITTQMPIRYIQR